MLILPISHKEIILKKPDSQTLLKASEKAQEGLVFSAVLEICKGSQNTIKSDELLSLPFVDCEIIVLEAFKLYKLPMELDGVYQCPRRGCGGIVVHEKNVNGIDNRPKYTDFVIEASPSPNQLFVLELNDDESYVLKSNEEELAILNTYKFKHPSLNDMIKFVESNKSKNAVDKLIGLYSNILVDVDGIVQSELSSPQIINRYKYQILNFPDLRTFHKITKGLREYGIQSRIELECPSCGNRWENHCDFASFFVSALTSLFS